MPPRPDKAYYSHEKTVEFLKKGFYAIKYNFSNVEKKEIRVKLSDCERFLVYDLVKERLRRWFVPQSLLVVKDVISLLYGGLTSTFKKHEEVNLMLMAQRR
mmetsp:Transcript_41142/g.53985  ORF Transcript_41142/g.53985 Transcript_41142/m.53985 type:complete len:101 (+) Transcript_41142:209-511(+)